MSFAKKCFAIPALGLVMLMASFIFISSNSSAKITAGVTENPYRVPTDAKVIETIVPGNTGTIQFVRTNTAASADKVEYKNYLWAAISFTTDGTNALYHYTYTNNTPVSLNYALYAADGTRVDEKYTAKAVAPGTTFEDVVRLDTTKQYWITVYTSNSEKIGDAAANSLCHVKVAPVPDDVGDLLTSAKPIELSKNFEQVLQGHPDVDCFGFESPGTAIAVTVQNSSDKAEDKLNVRFADRNGNELTTFTVDAGKIETKEVWKLQMKEMNYVFISAPNTKGDVKYSIKADPITRRIEYVLNSGQNNPENPNVWNVGEVINLKDATRAGYLFGGWFKDSNFSDSSKVTTINEGITEDLKLYAKWVKLKVDLPTDVKYVATKKSVTITFTKAEYATYTVFSCKGKNYKAKNGTVTIKGLGKNRRYAVKYYSAWKLPDGKTIKSSVKTVYVRTSK